MTVRVVPPQAVNMAGDAVSATGDAVNIAGGVVSATGDAVNVTGGVGDVTGEVGSASGEACAVPQALPLWLRAAFPRAAGPRR